MKPMLTAQTKPSIAAASATESIGSGLARHALRAAVNLRVDGDFAARSAGAIIGRTLRGSDIRPARPDMRRGDWLSFRRSEESVCDAESTITAFWTLTTSKGKRNSNRSTAVTRRLFASRYGSRRCRYSRTDRITCRSCAPTATASKRGLRIIPDIACERIENAQRQGRLIA